jgi:hypothetical protein
MLLAVGAHGDEVRLQEMDSTESPDYAALSYCWGDDGKLGCCTKETLDQKRRGIPVDTLPRTIQDGILMTRKLGIQYLWVDRLCIVQDDEEMKKLELRKMADVFSNAWLVIAAARAASSLEGFLHDYPAHGTVCQIPFNTNGGTPGHVLLYDHEISNKLEEELDTRAWTLEEDAVSIRLLRFGSKQVEWDCSEAAWRDSGIPLARILGRGTFAGKARQLVLKDDLSKQQQWARFKTPKAVATNSWYQSLMDYGARKLEKQSDRLPAFSAFAKLMGIYLDYDPQSSYWAGLWEDGFHYQLLWFRCRDALLSRSIESNAPTWSWASQPRRFKYAYPSFDDGGELTMQDVKYTKHLIDPENPFGGVHSGRLDLLGYMAKVKWTGEAFQFAKDGRFSLAESHRTDAIVWDGLSSPVHGFVWCLEVLKYANWSNWRRGLILEEIGDSLFKRVGYFEFWGEKPGSIPDKSAREPKTHLELFLVHSEQRTLAIL